MKIRTKIFSITGVVFLCVLIVSNLSLWTMNEIDQLKNTIDQGTALIAGARNLHGLMKDLIFDIFTPQTYRLLKDLIYTPRFQSNLRTFNKTVHDFESSFEAFMASPRVKSLLRDDELRDEYEVTKTMSIKAFTKIEAFRGSLETLVRSGVLGEESVYQQIQTDQDFALIKFFDEVRTTSYYLKNNFESFLNHFVRSLQEESAVIRRQIMVLFLILTAGVGLLTVMLSLLFAGRIAERLKTIEKGIARISLGDFETQLDIRTRDEFGFLSDKFNRFIKDLQKNVDSILNLMRDLGDVITDRLNFARLLELIVESAVNDSHADGAAIFTIKDNGIRLAVQRTAGAYPAALTLAPAALKPGGRKAAENHARLLDRVYRSGESLFLRNASEEEIPAALLYGTRLAGEAALGGISSLLAVPLTVSRHKLGVLSIVKVPPHGCLTDLDRTSLLSFADYAALIIDNFFKYKELVEKREAEYAALQSQIQPHFLYNVLNSFIGLNRLGDKKALERAIFSLKGMLRYTLEQGKWTTVAEELKFLQQYCALQKMRFGDRLEVRISWEEEVGACRIPKLLLQPLVENAVIHGIEPLKRPGKLNVEARMIVRNGSSCLGIFIRDEGIGFDAESLEYGRHIGLANVRERLFIAYPNASMKIQSSIGKGTLVAIAIIEEEARP